MRTVAIIKPDAVLKRHVGAIIRRIEEAPGPLQITHMKMVQLAPAQAEDFYEEHRGKEFFGPLIEFMTSGRCVALVLVGPNAIFDWRVVMGATNPRHADSASIRWLYGSHEGPIMHNAVHGSDSEESAEREYKILWRW